jgi:hypothetical protein
MAIAVAKRTKNDTLLTEVLTQMGVDGYELPKDFLEACELPEGSFPRDPPPKPPPSKLQQLQPLVDLLQQLEQLQQQLKQQLQQRLQREQQQQQLQQQRDEGRDEENSPIESTDVKEEEFDYSRIDDVINSIYSLRKQLKRAGLIDHRIEHLPELSDIDVLVKSVRKMSDQHKNSSIVDNKEEVKSQKA